MAIHPNNTPSGVNEPGLPFAGLLTGAPCPTPALTAETVALLDEQPARHDFSPAAIMARANAYAAKQVERALLWPVTHDPRSAVEILDEIRREIERGELPPEPFLAADLPHGMAPVSHNGTSQNGTLDLARARHMRRELEQAARHGTALLAALGLPRLVDDGFVQVDGDALGDALEVVLSHLDAIDALGEDLEETGDAEPWLAWVTSPSTGCVDTGISADDRELDTADAEPSLGSPEMHSTVISYVGGCWHGVEPDQRHWADGSTSDREAEITDEPHDDQEDEDTLGWPEDFTAKLDDVLQADHDPELDDADLEDSDEDEDYRLPWIDGPPPELIGGHAHG